MQESNSFSPLKTTVATFESYYLYRGDELLTRYGDARTEVPGFLSVLAEAGAEPRAADRRLCRRRAAR